MPEIPDLTVYLGGVLARLDGAALLGIRLANLFIPRSVSPTIEQNGKKTWLATDSRVKRPLKYGDMAIFSRSSDSVTIKV